MKEKQKNYFLNYLKGLACFGVVFFHVKCPIYHLDGIIQALFRFAVPVFFMISGFFCDTSDTEVLQKKIPGKVWHIGKICIVGCLYYLLFQIMIGLFGNSHGTLEALTERLHGIFNLRNFVEWILFNQDPFANILWFVFALLYCYLFLGVINRYHWYNRIFYLIPVLLCIHLLCGNVASLFGITISKIYYRNFLLFGLPFFLLGMFFRRSQQKILQKISESCCKCWMLLGETVCIAEWFLFQRQELYIGSILFVTGAFLLALHQPQLKKKSVIAWIGDKHSLTIYIVHYSFISVADRIAESLFWNIPGLNNIYVLIKPVLIFAMALCFSILFHYVIEVCNGVRKRKNA